MESIGIIALILIIVNAIVTYYGLQDSSFLDKYSFRVDKISVYKDYKRIVTAGFLHVDWMHFMFNMFSLFAFSATLEREIGPIFYLLIYMASLICGNLFALYVHKSHPNYSAVGASGAVCGMIFASIALIPGMGVSMFGAIDMPGWLYGLLYILISIYGIKTQAGNIGHEAHFGGAISGMVLSICLFPEALERNYTTILLIIIPSVIFLFYVFLKPNFSMFNTFFEKKEKYETMDERYHTIKIEKEKELNEILDKINKKGINSLTAIERRRLEELSN